MPATQPPPPLEGPLTRIRLDGQLLLLLLLLLQLRCIYTPRRQLEAQGKTLFCLLPSVSLSEIPGCSTPIVLVSLF